MRDTDIIEALREKLKVPVGRHLYAVLGTYKDLNTFSKKLAEAKTVDGIPFPKPVSVNKGILRFIPNDDFRLLVENEAKKPGPTHAYVEKAFNTLLQAELNNNLVVLANMELIFAYDTDLVYLRTLSTDSKRIILLLPGKRHGDRIIMFPGITGISRTYALPQTLIAIDHIWEVSY